MSRKLILNLAMSIDGFIADEAGNYDWIAGDGSTRLNTANKWSYSAFLEGVDTVVMGRASYDQNMHQDFKDKTVYVATTRPEQDHDNIHYISGDVCAAIRTLMERQGKDVYLFGGGKLIDNFLKADMIDEFIVGIIPIILGNGRPLFYQNNPTVFLKLEEYIVDEGIVIMRYGRR